MGEGLFAFASMDEVADAIDKIQIDYRRHCESARAIAESHFAAEAVLTRLLQDVGL